MTPDHVCISKRCTLARSCYLHSHGIGIDTSRQRVINPDAIDEACPFYAERPWGEAPDTEATE